MRHILLILFLTLTQAGTALAHHSFAVVYDREQKQLTVTGKVTEIFYTNPHSRIRFEAISGMPGKGEIWEGETWPRNVLARRGWTYEKLKVGDVVEIEGMPARDQNRHSIQMINLKRPADGWEIWLGLGATRDIGHIPER